MKRISAILAVIFVLAAVFAIPVSAKSYQTYTYSDRKSVV